MLTKAAPIEKKNDAATFIEYYYGLANSAYTFLMIINCKQIVLDLLTEFSSHKLNYTWDKLSSVQYLT